MADGSANIPVIPRDEEILGDWAEMELALGKAIYARAVATEDNAELAELAKAFQRVARSGRMSIALRDKLIRQRRQEARENPPPAPPRDYVRIAKRKAELRDAMRRVVWNEAEVENGERECLTAMIDDHLDNKRQPDDWGLEPLDEHVERLSAAWRLRPGAADGWRDKPAPPDDYRPDIRDILRLEDDDEDEDEFAAEKIESSA